MGIPFTNNLMPVVHLFPVNTITRRYITLDEVIPGAPSSEYFDFGSNFHFLNMSMNSDGIEVTIEFIDPTFHNFERVLALVNRKVYDPEIGKVCFEGRIGWVSGATERDIMYPRNRDSSLRVGSGGNQDGRLIMMNKELLSEPFWIWVTSMQYSVQQTGIKYIMKGKFAWHFEEAIYSQSDEVMPTNCCYATLFYRLASKMNVLVYFDTASIDLRSLYRNGALKWAFDNKKNMDNFSRLIEEINGQDKSLPPLQVSISSSYVDASKAITQISKLSTSSQMDYENLDSQTARLSTYNTIFTGIQWTQSVAGFFLGTGPLPTIGATVAANTAQANLSQNITSKDEITVLKDSLTEIMSHWNNVKACQVKSWKTYIISALPNKSGYKQTYSPSDKSKSSSQFGGLVFLGEYTHFGKDLQDLTPTSKGIDTTFSTLIASAWNMDETIARFTQEKTYSQIIQHTGQTLKHRLSMYKQAYKTPSALQKAAQQLNPLLPKKEDKKSAQTSKVQNTINYLNPGSFSSNVASSLAQQGYASFTNILTNYIRGGAAGAAQIEEEASKALESQTKSVAKFLQINENSSIDTVSSVLDSRYNEVINNPFIKDSFIPTILVQNVDNVVDREVSSLNPGDKYIKVIKQVTKLQLAAALLEAMKREAFDISYNREAIQVTVKVVGDIGITTDLIGNSVLHLQFFNPDGSKNQFVSGYYILKHFKHDISSSAIFTTEMTLLSHEFKGSGAQASPVIGGLAGPDGTSGNTINESGGNSDNLPPNIPPAGNPEGVGSIVYPKDISLYSAYRSYADNLGQVSWVQDTNILSEAQTFSRGIASGSTGINIPVGEIGNNLIAIQAAPIIPALPF